MLSRELLVGTLVASATLCAASVGTCAPPSAMSTPAAQAAQLDRSFSRLRHSALDKRLPARQKSCERSRAPEALATPDPLLDLPELRTRVAVSFIIGVDGRVHSPIILESAGEDVDRSVLDAVLSWRYRPATCNATPRDIESKIEFSSR